jgi:hypothetical protein
LPTPGGTGSPISGQPWPTPSGDPLSPEPYQPPPPAAHTPPSYSPGYATIPAPGPDYPPTTQFPAQPVNYAPPGHTPDFGHAHSQGGGYPPPAYGQPGYEQPAYGQPGYGQPGYGQPPPPPPRRSNVPLIAVILAVSLLLCGGVATAGVMVVRNVTEKAKEVVEPITELPTAVPEIPDLPTEAPGLSGHKIKVTYEVTGDGPVEILYAEKLGTTPVRLDDVKLPWKFTTEMETPALLSVVAMRVETSEGSITCRALVDGDKVKEVTSAQGNFATASCIHFALD